MLCEYADNEKVRKKCKCTRDLEHKKKNNK